MCGPRWHGECYSRLYEVWQELFTFSQARDFLPFDENRLSVAFSRLHSKRVPLIFDLERSRLLQKYRSREEEG